MVSLPKKAASLRRFGPDWLTLLSSILIVVSFPPWNHAFLIWIALVPWFAALARAPSSAAALGQGLWLSVLMSLGGFYWVAHVLQEFGGIPSWLAGIGLLLFSLIGQPQFTLFAPIWRWIRLPSPLNERALLARAVALALAYAGLDWILPKLFVDTLGHSQYQARYLRQVADLGGATLLTFAIFLTNESVFRLLTLLRSRTEPSLWPALRAAGAPLVLSMALILGAYGYGSQRYAEILRLESTPSARIQAAVIQGNIGDFDKIAAERGISGAADKVIDTFFQLSDQALALSPKPQLLIWPETSYPSTFRTPQTAEEMARDQRIERFVRSRGVPLLFGGYDHADGKDFNAFFYLSPTSQGGIESGGDLKTYRKNMLLLFGEYIPGAEQFQFIKSAFPQVGNFGRGVGPSVVEAGGVRTGPIICYEALFPNYVIEAARRGSQMILNITNDSWFGPSGEPELHLSLTTFRSVETRLPQLRATNTGISALILPDGEITQPTPIGAATILNASVPINEPIPTLMKRWGDWFGPAAFGMGWAGILAVAGWGRRRSRASDRA